ncbi:hypothetical protein C0991_011297 [Blastosporella zonata]|nr:hypothetical protein C0991_011297 [Blastosporella zonata]
MQSLAAVIAVITLAVPFFAAPFAIENLTAGVPYPYASYVPVESVTPQATRANQFAAAFSEDQEAISSRARFGWIWPLAEIFEEIFEDKTKKPMAIVRAYLDPIIQDAMAKKAAADTSGSEEKAAEAAHVEEGGTLIDDLVNLSSGESPLDSCEPSSDL